MGPDGLHPHEVPVLVEQHLRCRKDAIGPDIAARGLGLAVVGPDPEGVERGAHLADVQHDFLSRRVLLHVAGRGERVEPEGDVEFRLAIDVVEEGVLREQRRLSVHDPALGALACRQEGKHGAAVCAGSR